MEKEPNRNSSISVYHNWNEKFTGWAQQQIRRISELENHLKVPYVRNKETMIEEKSASQRTVEQCDISLYTCNGYPRKRGQVK